jgi:O-succinylbenzoic acid--CoA ligase
MNRLVALAMPGGPGFVEELIRAWDDSDAVLPVDLRLAPPARARLLQLMAPAVLVDETGIRHTLDGVVPTESTDALVMATSGTTGDPKGVVLTHEALAASARATSTRLGVDPTTDRWWACLPLAHIGGLSVVTRSLLGGVGCEVVGGFSGEGAVEALERGATLTALVPTALGRLDPAVAGRFRQIVLGGQAPPPDLPANVVTTYGLTETASGIVYNRLPLTGVGVRIEDGEILVRGPMLLRCYRDGTDPKDADGWFRTGDAGSIGADGQLSVHGRIAELVITGGENVWPSAVEAIVRTHSAVLDVAVGGVADAEWGERVCAYVVVGGEVEAGVLLAELRELVSAELAAFAAPREVVVVPHIPRTALGKVRREALARLEGPSSRL